MSGVNTLLICKILYLKEYQVNVRLKVSSPGFHSQTQKLELHTKKTAACESTAEEVSFEL